MLALYRKKYYYGRNTIRLSTDKMVDPIENLNDGFQELAFLMYLSLSTFVLYSVFSSFESIKKQHDGIREPPLPYCHYDKLHPSNSYSFLRCRTTFISVSPVSSSISVSFGFWKSVNGLKTHLITLK
jgi:hypothetical protein